ncbi:MAG: hypothetical protein AB7O38_17365 [Pirellulaceae bacterium]
MDIPVRLAKGVSPQRIDDIEALVNKHHTLADVAKWLATRKYKAIPDVVTQDEYTHDVIVKLDFDRYLTYDVT